jgi:hypothetical protein
MLFAAAIFVSATLLFLVQLIMGKMILPWYGGSPAVWTTCMLFFQLVLLGGYAYAHGIDSALPPRRQVRLHIGLLLLSAVLLLLLVATWRTGWIPTDALRPDPTRHPVPQILLFLLATTGLPFFLLSSTSPLLQRWYSLLKQGGRPYRLYAVSNAGSLLGLLSYPALVEPALDLPQQIVLWTGCYVTAAALCLACAARLARNATHLEQQAVDTRLDAASPSSPRANSGGAANGGPMVCLLLAACTSGMFLAVTNQLCQEIAVVPFLWVLPLAIYLLSFIICFDRPEWCRRGWLVPACVLATLAVLVTTLRGLRLGLPVHLLANGLFLLVFCTTLHGELVALRPPPRYLTRYYLAIALGGALGGIFVGIVAPLWFSGYWEFHTLILAGWVVLAVAFWRNKRSFFFSGDPRLFALTVFIVCLLAARALLASAMANRLPWLLEHDMAVSLVTSFIVTALIAATAWRTRFVRSRYWPRLAVGLTVLIAECFLLNRTLREKRHTVESRRNFYGVVRVRASDAEPEKPPLIKMTHGRILHGLQILTDESRLLQNTYYATNSGIDLAIRLHPRRSRDPAHPQPLRIGVLGMGVGTMAAFCRELDRIRFYEINPAVIAFATGEGAYFTYIPDCAGEAEWVLGDARLSLERELADGYPQRFDVLVMDAFTSDAVPVHLLTVEAFDGYVKHLRDEESIIAVNISNRFLDFRDLTFSLARRFGMTAALVRLKSRDFPFATSSLWVLMTRDRSFLQQETIQQRVTEHAPARPTLWTDSHSDLFRLLILKRSDNPLTGAGEVEPLAKPGSNQSDQ